MLLELSIKWCLAYRACCFELSMWPMHRVQQSEALGDTIVQIPTIDFKWMKAGNVELGQVHGRFPFNYPLRQRLAHPRRAEHCLGVKACRDVQAADFWGLADDEFVIRSEAFGAVQGKRRMPIECKRAIISIAFAIGNSK